MNRLSVFALEHRSTPGYVLLAMLLTGSFACNNGPEDDDDSSASPTPTPIYLSGPTLAYSPSTLDLGAVDVGDSVTDTVTLSNQGDSDLSLVDIAVTDENGAGVFSLSEPFEQFSVAPGESATVAVLFAPATAGTHAGTLSIQSNDEDHALETILLTGEGRLTAVDQDADGYLEDEDCDDLDPTVHPDAPEGVDENADGVLDGDGKDNDCDGIMDEGTDAYDDDEDGYTELEGDCNDEDPSVGPDAEESCGDGIDQDCDGEDLICPPPPGDLLLEPCPVDFGVVEVGVGGIETVAATNIGQGDLELLAVTVTGDTFSLDAEIEPRTLVAGEQMTLSVQFLPIDVGMFSGTLTIDSDDPDSPSASCILTGEATVLIPDLDEDGFTADVDCDDENPAVFPGAPEGVDNDGDGVLEGDGLDNDCDEIVDEGTNAFDDDEDGYTELEGDCSDEDATVHPEAAEGVDSDEDGILEGNGRDDDCDGTIDEGTDLFDDDGDGFTEAGGDCNDGNATVYPGAVEGTEADGGLDADGLDNDCDGLVDEGTRQVDDDGDGFTEVEGDCNDEDPEIFPGAEEGVDTDGDGIPEGNGVDDDCDGIVDNGTTAFDDDGDGYTELRGDCDDTDPTVHPNAPEGLDADGDGVLEHDGKDNDCDGTVDESTDVTDDDGDGFTELDGDCNDRNSSIFPEAPEGTDVTGDGIPEGDGLDNDCDGDVDEGTSFSDDDGDGYTELQGDCDDGATDVFPGAPEGVDANEDGTLDGDGVDNNCNSTVDEGTDAYDDDEDGFIELDGDCNDGNEDIFPGADEANVFGEPNGIDDDCDGLTDEDFVVQGEILIAELMVSPTAAAGQYLELFNGSERDIDLRGWTLSTSAGTLTLSPEAPLVVGPDQVLLVAASAKPEENGGLSPDTVAEGLLLEDTDTASIGIPDVPVDEVSWDDTWTITAGASLTLDSEAQLDGINDDAALWCVARDPFGGGDLGTPGVTNGPCPDIDHDNDGYTQDGEDCDDFCDLVNPGAEEVIDTMDNNCDNVLAPGETPVEVALESAGFNDGDRAKIYVEGIPVGTNGYGYNIVTMDPITGEVLDARNFDTWHTTNAATDMANYLMGLPEQRIVLLAVRADGFTNMNESAYAAIEDLGSALVRQLAANDSFSLVGKKGLAPGQAAERRVLRYSGTATAGSFRLATPVAVRVESAGYEDGNYVRFYVDGERLDVATYRGISVVVVDEYTGEVLDFATFDTYCCSSNASALAYFIRSLDPGQMVLAGVKDEATAGMNEEGFTALESVGSGLIRQLDSRGAWALIGRKGSFPNNVIGEAWTPKNSGNAVVEDQESCFGSP